MVLYIFFGNHCVAHKNITLSSKENVFHCFIHLICLQTVKRLKRRSDFAS